MSKRPVVYELESQIVEGADWLPVLDEHRQPITFRGRGSKAQALTMAEIVRRWPSFYGVRVRCGDQIVKAWTKQGGVSA
jgi:hypothetical protein